MDDITAECFCVAFIDILGQTFVLLSLIFLAKRNLFAHSKIFLLISQMSSYNKSGQEHTNPLLDL